MYLGGYYKDGASTILEIDENPATLQPVNLTRAIARVDVSVKDVPPPGPSPRDKFSLESVHLYNYSRAGQLAPKVSAIPGNLDGYDGEQWKNLAIPAPAGIKAAAPHVPGYGDLKVKGPVEYEIDTDPAAPHAYEFRKEIYTYKSTVEAVKMKNTCLVIGGYYNGNPTPTYYRVDFVNSLKERIPLLRNYRYDVEIQEVNGHGYPTPEDAYANDPANIVVTIVPWNDGVMNDVVFNDQHYLSVNKSELVFYTNGDAKSIEAITDFPAGWTVESLPAWLTVIAPTPVAKGDAGVQTTLTLKAGVLDSGDPARESFFYIVAGNLKKKITVRQLDEAEFSLEVAPEELVFFARQTTPKQVGISSIPVADGTSYSLEFSHAGGLSWTTFPTFVAPMLHVDLIPDDRALPASNTLYGMVQVTLKGTDGRSVSKVINVRQLNRDMEFHAYPDNSYPAVGGDDLEFTVASEGKWRLLPNVADAYLTLKDPIEETTGHHPPVTSFTYPFKLTSNVNSYAPRTATVEVNLDNLAFSPAISFDIVQAGTPPYLVITDPAAAGAPPAHEYDFGDKNLPKTITFKTNAGWTFSTDGNFDKVISEVTYGGFPIYAGLPAQTGSTIPTMEVEENVIFTPIASALAGETVTNVIFTTVNQEGAPETPPSVVSLSRLVPANWEFLYAKEGNTLLKDGDNISPAATIVTLAANTNLQWWGKQGTAEPEYSNPSAYTMDDKIDMTISKRPTDQTSSWNTPENITITVGYDAQTGIPALSPVHQFTLKRPIYELYVSNINPTTVPCYAGTVNVTFNSNADDYYVQWRNSSNENTSAVIGTAQILVSGVGTQTVPYPATGAFQDRSLYLYNALTGKLLYDTEVSQRMPRYTTGTVQGTRGGSSTTNCPTGYSRSYTGGV